MFREALSYFKLGIKYDQAKALISYTKKFKIIIDIFSTKYLDENNRTQKFYKAYNDLNNLINEIELDEIKLKSNLKDKNLNFFIFILNQCSSLNTPINQPPYKKVKLLNGKKNLRHKINFSNNSEDKQSILLNKSSSSSYNNSITIEEARKDDGGLGESLITIEYDQNISDDKLKATFDNKASIEVNSYSKFYSNFYTLFNHVHTFINLNSI